MVDSLEKIAIVIVSISTLLAMLIIISYFKLSQPLKIVGTYIIVGAAIDIVSTALYYKQENNLEFLHLFTFFEFVILSHLFNTLFSLFKSKVNVLYIAIPTTIFIILNAFLIQGIDSLNSYSSFLTSVLIIGFCIHFFILILDLEIKNFQLKTTKWFIICLFFYHSASLIVMLFGNLILDISREAVSYIWVFRSLLILTTKVIISYFFIRLILVNNHWVSYE